MAQVAEQPPDMAPGHSVPEKGLRNNLIQAGMGPLLQWLPPAEPISRGWRH